MLFRWRALAHWRPLIRALVFAAMLGHGAGAPAQMLFPDLLPPEASLVLSVPDLGGPWLAQEPVRVAAAVEEALSAWQGAAAGSGMAANGSLLAKGLSAAELAILPPRAAQAGAGLLWVGKIRDIEPLRQAMASMEEEAAREMEAPQNPVTRTTEGIGDSALRFLTDSQSSAGYLINGPQSVWAFSNHPEALRETARRLAGRTGAAEKKSMGAVPPAAWADAVAAFDHLQEKNPDSPFHVRFFLRPSTQTLASGAPALDRALETLAPRGATGGGLRFEPQAIRVESFTQFAANDPSVALYERAKPLARHPGTGFIAPGALLDGGNCLLDVALLKRRILDALVAGPEGQASPLTAPQPAETDRLEPIRHWARDAQSLREIGPGWFYAIQNFEFLKPGEFPRVDLLLGIETGDATATAKAMRQLENAILKAGSDYLRNRMREAQAGAAQGPPTTATLMADETLWSAPASPNPIAIRFFSSPLLPGHLRPAWAVTPRFLLIGLSPETISQSLERAGADSGQESDRPQKTAGNGPFHAVQTIRFAKAIPIGAAILQAALRKANPDAVPLIGQLAGALRPLESATFHRIGESGGIRTAGEIRIREKASNPNNGSTAPVQ